MMTSDRRPLFPIYCALALLAGAVIFEGALIGWLFTKVQVLESEAREQKTLLVQPSPDTVAEEEPTSSAEVALREGTSYVCHSLRHVSCAFSYLLTCNGSSCHKAYILLLTDSQSLLTSVRNFTFPCSSTVSYERKEAVHSASLQYTG